MEITGFYAYGGADSGAGHRGNHSDLHADTSGDAALAAGRATRPTLAIGDSDHCCFSNGYTQGHGRLQPENHWIFFSWEAYKYLRAHTPAFENLLHSSRVNTTPTLPCGQPVPQLLSRCETASMSPAISSRRLAFLPGGDGSSPMQMTGRARRQ